MGKRQRLIKDRAVISAKNAVRGAIANERALADVLPEALLELAPHAMSSVIDWLQRFPSKKGGVYPVPVITEYADLWPSKHTLFEHVDTALVWSTEFLRRNEHLVNSFLRQRERFDLSFLSGDYTTALAGLDEIQKSLGLSIWYIEARIALLQRLRGLEAQKEYARSIHESAPRTLASFLAYYTSQRNEDSTSIVAFNDRVEPEIGRQPVTEEVRTYIRNRLLGRSSALTDDATLAAALSVAASTSLIDAYETVIDAFQAMFGKAEFYPLFRAIYPSVSRFAAGDWRLQKLGMIADGPIALRYRDLAADKAMLTGDFAQAAQRALKQAAVDRSDIDALAVAASAFAAIEAQPDVESLSPVQSEFLSALTALKSPRGSGVKAAGDLQKLAENLRTVRVSGAMLGYLHWESLQQVQVGPSDATTVFLATPHLNPRHWTVLDPAIADRLLANAAQRVPGDVVNTSISLYRTGTVDGNFLEGDQGSIARIRAALYHGDFDLALGLTAELTSSASAYSRLQAARFEILCFVATGDEDNATRSIARYCSASDSPEHLLPLRQLLGGRRWRDLRHLQCDIALPIVLDIFWRTIDEIEHDTNRRIAYDEFLRCIGCRRPSELGCRSGAIERSQLIYFLTHVAVPSVMEVSFDVFPTSRATKEERIRICSLLSELDPDNSSVYAEELKNISTEISIEDGLRDVDRSRVHVDIDAVGRWAERHVQEEFFRYKDLLRANVGFASPEDFQIALRKLNEGDRSTMERLLDYPEQEGDALLVDIFEQVKAEFLTNSDYGLDAYLSMRIRHGSLSGHMRGPLEERNLIVSKDGSDARYTDNAAIVERLRLSDSDPEAIFSAFREFSREYDRIIEDLTKNRLQINRPERPLGMFNLHLRGNPLAVHYVRSHVQEATTFSEFLALLFTGIEVLLQQDLISVREHILHDVKPQVGAAFEQLRSQLERTISIGDYLKINSEVADVIPGVQAAIDRIADWFVPMEKQEVAVRTFEEIVEIGIAVARAAHRGFSPRIDRDIEEFGVRSAVALSEVTDILFTVLDNVYSHSGNRTSPWVKLRVWTEDFDPPYRKVNIRVESEVAPGSYSDSIAEKLERIRRQMESGEYRKHVNLEGGTGLLKLKRLTALDDRQKLMFGFVEQSAFFVQLELILKFVAIDRSALG